MESIERAVVVGVIMVVIILAIVGLEMLLSGKSRRE